MGRMFYKGGTGMQWEYYWSFPKYLSLLVSSSPMWQSTTLTSFVEATQGKVKVHDLTQLEHLRSYHDLFTLSGDEVIDFV